MASIEMWQLKQRQSLPLSIKEKYTNARIRAWYEYWNGQVYVSFSGGKDSTVLLHQVRRLYPDVPAVFCDTGLEYPEIREFVKTIENVVWMKPKMSFKKVLETYGYPIVSKKVARFVRDLQNPTDRNAAVRNLRLTGMNRKGVFCPSQILPKKWRPLIEAPFKVSDKCCDVMKKEPLLRYAKETGRRPMTAVMAYESGMREKMYLKNGCNVFSGKNAISMPMAFWVEDDIWKYIHKYDVEYSTIYDMGEKRTGCCFCMFGVHLEKGTNRFQRMKSTHPTLYNYCMNTLGLKQCLQFIGVQFT
jgi:3'-phosphoadenosine 5'-phosphosulfate sulfotransferase (PAPS reductase)/FAD synthetase